MVAYSHQITRRRFHQALGAAAAGCWLTRDIDAELRPARLASYRDFRIREIRRTTVKVPYRDVPRRAMDRELPHWRYTEICEVELNNGTVGLGETLLYYTWGIPSDNAVRDSIGKNAADLMWNDSLGAGMQIALFDAVAKSAGVPVHRLLGRQVHQSTPLSWWNIDMPPEDMASECETAFQAGYMSYKTKGRPWFDLWEQVAQSCKRVPDEFKIDMDFNATLLDADRAIPILTEFESYPQIDIYESPIPQSDVEGNRRICEATRVNIALHYGSPAPPETVRQKVCDGFVVGGGATSLMRAARFSETVDLPFWLQLVGTGLTAAHSIHFGGVLSHATWPAVNCHQLYVDDLLAEPIKVENGFAAVPDTTGLGVDLNWDSVEKYRVERPSERVEPRRLLETTWPDGRVMHTASNGTVNFMLNPAMQGKMPFFEKGVQTRMVADDGSREWQEAFEKAQQGPRMVKE